MSAAANVQLLCSLNGKTETKKAFQQIHTSSKDKNTRLHKLCESVMKNMATYVCKEKQKKPCSLNLVSLTYWKL